MAKSSQSLQFVCRSCSQSISRLSLSQSQQLREFSNSALRSDSIPRFTPTSIPGLDALLLDWRQRVFTPAALNATHQALIYKKSRKPILENDPGVTVTMSDGEEVRLQPMDAYDKPNKRDSLHQVTQILSTTTDAEAWAQLPSFLEGLRASQPDMPHWFLEKLTRKANEQGMAGVIKKCAAMSKKTGVVLSIRPVTRELFLGSHMRLIEARNQKQSFEQEQNFAENLALMVESKDHCGALKGSPSEVDMRKDLTIAGVLLEFAAAKAIQTHKGKDVDGIVATASKRLVALAGNDVLRKKEKGNSAHSLEDWLPISNGIRLAMQVSSAAGGQNKNAETELKSSLKKMAGQLESAIEAGLVEVRAEANGRPRRAIKMYEAIKKN